ncbi:YlqD family protein [Tumebacillus sp. ITR2]|uniref:YlqD family protein n=1 Tax=Tumebacillus amylolyticus TaxID=2801339 RepID=A0ABS1JF06_9BACL|nr:YlqD family protein [Tumebacillus amylolyticus]MBL0388868.1 YlqD family protein [Tumebacillus amylolyticus]
MFTVKVPVAIKLILTEGTKKGITGEINQAIQGIQHELEQIEFQARKALQDAEQHGPEAVQGLTARINQERGARMERREQLMQQLVQIQQSEIGAEINGGQVESTVDIRVGDNWEEKVQVNEIVLKDGVVVEIRRAGL